MKYIFKYLKKNLLVITKTFIHEHYYVLILVKNCLIKIFVSIFKTKTLQQIFDET